MKIDNWQFKYFSKYQDVSLSNAWSLNLINTKTLVFLSDPDIPGVRSMGPSLSGGQIWN